MVLLFLFSSLLVGGGVYWQDNGIQICSLMSSAPKNVYDGNGKIYILWKDDRGIDEDIYGQKVDIAGNFLWQVNGIPIATTSGQLHAPEDAISDAEGGAITVWEDGRQWFITGTDIYAQRVDSMGNLVWGSSGTAVCAADSEQQYPKLVGDGKGGAIFAWEEHRNGIANRDIYAQRIDTNGTIKWQNDGTPVCTLGGRQSEHDIIEDGEGGAVILWNDFRNVETDIYCQRLDSLGMGLWANNGKKITFGNWPHG